MAKLTGADIKVGATVFMAGFDFANQQDIPLELIVESEVWEKKRFRVSYADPTKTRLQGPSSVYDEPGLWVYVSDRGVRPYNYDDRVTQMFTTREEMQAAIDLWAGKNPNWIKEE